jgi:hypothetical protein
MPFHRLTHVHSPETLAMLYRVYDNVLSIALERGPSPEGAEAHAFRDRIGALILDAYAEGEDDPEMLKHLALVRLATPPKGGGPNNRGSLTRSGVLP